MESKKRERENHDLEFLEESKKRKIADDSTDLPRENDSNMSNPSPSAPAGHMNQNSNGNKYFDLNIEKILESWEICHGLREIIANGLDEATLCGSVDGIKIYREADTNNTLVIQDFGRGMEYAHLTQKENKEKLTQPDKVIGQFGVGLKDALGILHRHKVGVTIHSKHISFTLKMVPKYSFNEVTTLHAVVQPPVFPTMKGTKFELIGISDADLVKAKSYFYYFSSAQVLETTRYGEVIEKLPNEKAYIFIKGLKAAEEEDFLFSYNITSTDANIRKALNRERRNVGRTAYSERVKSILLSSRSKKVLDLLIENLKHISTGSNKEELNWKAVQEHAAQQLASTDKNIVLVSATELREQKHHIELAVSTNHQVVSLPENVIKSLQKAQAPGTLARFVKQQKATFEYEFVNPDTLTKAEKAVWKYGDLIFEVAGGIPPHVQDVLLAKTLACTFDNATTVNYASVWEASLGRIILKRSVLTSLVDFAQELLSVICRINSGANSLSVQYEQEVKNMLGILFKCVVDSRKSNGNGIALTNEDSEETQLVDIKSEDDFS